MKNMYYGLDDYVWLMISSLTISTDKIETDDNGIIKTIYLTVSEYFKSDDGTIIDWKEHVKCIKEHLKSKYPNINIEFKAKPVKGMLLTEEDAKKQAIRIKAMMP